MLKNVLLVNALSTLLSGLCLILFHQQLARIFEINSGTPFWVLGLVITYFSFTMFYEWKRLRALALLWILLQDTFFVLGCLAILLWQPFAISTTGYLLIALFSLIIVFFIVYQSIGLAQLDSLPGTSTKVLLQKTVVHADRESCWQVIADLENYHKLAPNIDAVRILSGSGKGMVRSCSHGENSWSETCTLWEKGTAYAFEIDTNAPNYPYPFKKLSGHWQLTAISPSQTELSLTFKVQYAIRIYNLLLHPFAMYKYTRIVEELLSNWKKQVAEESKAPKVIHVFK